MKAINLLPLMLLLAACGSDNHDGGSAVVAPPGPTGVAAADIFTSNVALVVQTASDDTEPISIDAYTATMPEDTEPVPVP